MAQQPTRRLRGRKWMELRHLVLNAEPRCAECLRQGRLSIAEEVDHVDGDRGNNRLDNLQGLCKPCHDTKTRRQMGWKAKPTIGADGWPVGGG